jgi:hypothetical protein
MDLTAPYCQTRKTLEERVLILVGKLVDLTSQLPSLIGIDHQRFISAKAACNRAEIEIAENRRQLQTHRSEHGC